MTHSAHGDSSPAHRAAGALGAVAMALGGAVLGAHAADAPGDYPSRPIRAVVPSPAGHGSQRSGSHWPSDSSIMQV